MTGQHKTRLVGWHPSDPELVAWLDAEIERRGGGRGAQSTILDEALKGAAMNDAAGRLAEIRAMTGTGPFGTETEARAAAIALGEPPEPGWSILSPDQRRAMLTAACEAAGVTLGAYDERVIGWLAGWEDATCAVVAGIIRRAAAQPAEARDG